MRWEGAALRTTANAFDDSLLCSRNRSIAPFDRIFPQAFFGKPQELTTS
jgi:hypothetical protein